MALLNFDDEVQPQAQPQLSGPVVFDDEVETPQLESPEFKTDTKYLAEMVAQDVMSDAHSDMGGLLQGYDTHQEGSNVQFGKNVASVARSLIPGGLTEENRINTQLSDYFEKYPELKNSPEGKKLQEDINKRVTDIMKADELTFSEMSGHLLEIATNNPSQLVDIILSEMYYNPLLPIATAAAYMTGNAIAGSAINASRLKGVIQQLKLGKPRSRLAAFTIENAMRGTGVATMEAGIGATDEISRNVAVGREPMKNTLTMAQFAAAMGLTTSGIGTGLRVLKGDLRQYKMFEQVVNQKMKEGYSGTEVMQFFEQRMDDMPFKDIVKELVDTKREDIASKVQPNTPGRQKKIDVEDIAAYFDEVMPGIDENSSTVRPTGVDADGNIFFNIKNIWDDFRGDLNFLRGRTKKGKEGVSDDAMARQEAFKDVDFDALRGWIIKNGGAKGYAKLLNDMEHNRLKYGADSVDDLAQGYRNALRDSLESAGGKYGDVLIKTKTQKVAAGLKAGATYTAKSIGAVLKDPSTLYRPVKDIFVDSGRFVKDVVQGTGDVPQYVGKFQDILRDWEGNKMRGELEINMFTHWFRKQVKDPQKREALAHYMEDNLDEYNAYREATGRDKIEWDSFTKEEQQMASIARKYFDDLLDWGQRAELFQHFRNVKINQKKLDKTNMSQGMKDFLEGYEGQVIPDDNLWQFIKDLDDPRMEARDLDTMNNLHRRENYVPHMVNKKFAPTEEMLMESALDDAHRSSRLQTRSRFMKPRVYNTMMDAIYAGEKLHTQDIATLMNAYGKSMVRAEINNRLMQRMQLMRTSTGKPLIGQKWEVPNHYLEFKHPNYQNKDGSYMYVDPNIAPDLRLYFDTNEPNIANRVLQNLIMITKRAALGLSFFHMAALGWSGMAAGQGIDQVFKNLVPGMKSKGLKALAGQEGYDELMEGLRNGLGIGVLEELKGDTLINALRKMANFADGQVSSITHFKPLGKMVAAPIRGTARLQEIIDTHLWDHVNTGLKATTYLGAIERLVYQDAARASRTGTPMTDMNLLRQRAAQYTNDAYGNQNWNQMAMNVQSKMGHRIAAALNKPSTRGYIRMLVFAPDWSLSNLRVVGKGLTGIGGEAGINRLKDKATSEYIRYSIRSAILFAFIGETLQQAAGEGSIFDDSLKDALRPDIGGGKQMELSKQLAEVIRAYIHGPGHVVSHKLSTPLKALRDTNSVSDFAFEWAQNSAPIGIKQAIANKDPSGILGAPIFDK